MREAQWKSSMARAPLVTRRTSAFAMRPMRRARTGRSRWPPLRTAKRIALKTGFGAGPEEPSRVCSRTSSTKFRSATRVGRSAGLIMILREMIGNCESVYF